MAKYPVAYLIVAFPRFESLKSITTKALAYGIVFVTRMTCMLEGWRMMSEYNNLSLGLGFGNPLKRMPQPLDIQVVLRIVILDSPVSNTFKIFVQLDMTRLNIRMQGAAQYSDVGSRKIDPGPV